jgi:FkbM family methyltransferase
MSNWLLQNLLVPNGSVIIDVGANFGWYSCILAKKFPTAELYAFEPEADAFTMLGKNVSENNLPNVRMFKHALGSSSGILKLYVSASENTGTHSAVRLENSSHMVEVDVVPLDHVISAEGVALMKIDAEGSEYSILLGAESTLRRTRVVMLEFTPNLLVRMGVEPRALLDLMISAGFAIGVVDSLGKLVTETAEGLLEDAATQPLWQKDLIFFRA